MSDTAPGGVLRINESDFDPMKHVRADPNAPLPLPPPPILPPPPGPLDGLPADWRDKPAKWLRETAERLTARTPDNREQAIQLIEAWLKAG